jgi:hypothetical protein
MKPVIGACAGTSVNFGKRLAQKLFTRENLWALLLCLLLIALVILTADLSPTWIYQGF